MLHAHTHTYCSVSCAKSTAMTVYAVHRVNKHAADKRSRTLTTTNSFMFAVPVLLLAFDRAIACVPTAVVHCFWLTVVALKHIKHGK